jgi:predicted nucleotidyltransferase
MDAYEYRRLIKKIKNKYKGIELTAIVGSLARGEATEKSDIDILYKIDDAFLYEVDPLLFFTYLNEIKNDIARELGKKVDLIDVTTLNSVAKKYMLKDKIDV